MLHVPISDDGFNKMSELSEFWTFWLLECRETNLEVNFQKTAMFFLGTGPVLKLRLATLVLSAVRKHCWKRLVIAKKSLCRSSQRWQSALQDFKLVIGWGHKIATSVPKVQREHASKLGLWISVQKPVVWETQDHLNTTHVLAKSMDRRSRPLVNCRIDDFPMFEFETVLAKHMWVCRKKLDQFIGAKRNVSRSRRQGCFSHGIRMCKTKKRCCIWVDEKIGHFLSHPWSVLCLDDVPFILAVGLPVCFSNVAWKQRYFWKHDHRLWIEIRSQWFDNIFDVWTKLWARRLFFLGGHASHATPQKQEFSAA